MVIYLQPDTPNEYIPKIGTKLVSIETDTTFSGGFMGCVKYIQKDDDKITICCKQLMVSDVFDRYYGSFEMGIPPQKDTKHKINTNNYFDKAIDFGSIIIDYHEGISKPFLLGTEVEIGYDIGGEISFPNERFLGCLIFEREIGTFFSMTIGGNINLVASISSSGKMTFFSKDLISKYIAIEPIAPFVYIYGKIGVSHELSSQINLSSGIEVLYPYTITINHSSKTPSNVPAGLKFGKPTIKCNPSVISGGVNYSIGGFFELGIAVACEEVGKISYRGEAGVQFGLNASFDIHKLHTMYLDSSYYDIVKAFDWKLTPYKAHSIEMATIHGIRYKKSFTKSYEQPWLEAKLVPSFNNVNYKKNGNIITLLADVSENVFPAIAVGFCIRDIENSEVFSNYYKENYLKYLYNNRFHHYEISLTNFLSLNKKYKLHPIVKLFNHDKYKMLAYPSCDMELLVTPQTDEVNNIEGDEAILIGHLDGDTDYINSTCNFGFMYSKNSNPIADGNIVYSSLINNTLLRSKLNNLEDGTTYYYCAFLCIDGEYTYGEVKSFKTLEAAVEVENLNMKSASYYPNRYTYNGKKYSFKYYCITTVELKRNKNVEDWGYIYEDPDGSKARISCKNQSNIFQDDRYAYCRNEHSSKVKLYGYVKYINKEDTCYGKAKEFPISYPVGSTITMTNSEFKGTETDVDYQGKTYKYKSTFRFPFTASGAYWLKVKTKEDGEGWNGWNNLPDRVMSPVDGTNALTVNYYYNEQMFDGDFIVYLYGNDETHTLFYKTGEYATLSYFNGQFTGCTYHSMAGNSKGISVSKKEKDEVYEFVINKCF